VIHILGHFISSLPSVYLPFFLVHPASQNTPVQITRIWNSCKQHQKFTLYQCPIRNNETCILIHTINTNASHYLFQLLKL